MAEPEPEDASSVGGTAYNEPLDLVGVALNEVVFVKLRGDRELTGRLHVSFASQREISPILQIDLPLVQTLHIFTTPCPSSIIRARRKGLTNVETHSGIRQPLQPRARRRDRNDLRGGRGRGRRRECADGKEAVGNVVRAR